MRRKNMGVVLGLSIALTSMAVTGCGSSNTKETAAKTTEQGNVATETSTQEKKENDGAQKASSNTYKVTYNYNYDGAPESYVDEVEPDNATTPPDDPTQDGAKFTGWYTDAECTEQVDFEVAITGDVTYYAGWEKSGVTVTFDPNYEGAEVIVESVNVGSTVSTPATPEREGYIFNGWYTDAEATEAFDFTTAVSEEITLYAGWDKDDGNSKKVTYMMNMEGEDEVYDVVPVKVLGYATAPSINKEGYYLEGWYTNAECTEAFDFATERIRDDVTLYAHWLKEFQFEAEYTDLTGLEGMGYSGNASGTKMIEDGTSRGASNGHYIGWMYNEGLTLTFNVTSDAAVDDAKLALSLSAEYYDITLTSDNYTVAVNGEKVDYDDISFTGTSESDLPFNTYVLEPEVSLKEGDNVITLSVTNAEKKTGTIYATAPLVDCLYVYSDSTVEWGEGFPMTDNVK